MLKIYSYLLSLLIILAIPYSNAMENNKSINNDAVENNLLINVNQFNLNQNKYIKYFKCTQKGNNTSKKNNIQLLKKKRRKKGKLNTNVSIDKQNIMYVVKHTKAISDKVTEITKFINENIDKINKNKNDNEKIKHIHDREIFLLFPELQKGLSERKSYTYWAKWNFVYKIFSPKIAETYSKFIYFGNHDKNLKMFRELFLLYRQLIAKQEHKLILNENIENNTNNSIIHNTEYNIEDNIKNNNTSVIGNNNFDIYNNDTENNQNIMTNIKNNIISNNTDEIFFDPNFDIFDYSKINYCISNSYED